MPNPAYLQIAELQAMARAYRGNAKVRTVSRTAARRAKSARQFLALAFA